MLCTGDGFQGLAVGGPGCLSYLRRWGSMFDNLLGKLNKGLV